jgi:hypothetical protein
MAPDIADVKQDWQKTIERKLGRHLRDGESAAESESSARRAAEPDGTQTATNATPVKRLWVFGYISNVSTVGPRVTFLNGLTPVPPVAILRLSNTPGAVCRSLRLSQRCLGKGEDFGTRR